MIDTAAMRALAIVPALNEERNLPRLLESLRRDAPRWEVCVVDDGSTDGTPEVARRHGAVVLRLPANLGIGAAVQTGYLWAREHLYDVAAQIDGDGQHDPRFLATALVPIEAGESDCLGHPPRALAAAHSPLWTMSTCAVLLMVLFPPLLQQKARALAIEVPSDDALCSEVEKLSRKEAVSAPSTAE